MLRNLFLFSAAMMTLFSCSRPLHDTMEYANTLQVLPTDSMEVVMEKSAHVVPTVNQMSALENEFIAFVHFGPNTFTRREWGTGMESPEVFDLKQLDTDQWVRSMKDAGMKMVIFTAKHHDGFVLWQSRYTKHGVMSTGFRDGKGDVLKDLAESCRKYGMKLGVYLSPADLYQIESPEGLYGNGSKYTTRTIPRSVEGRPFENKTTFEFEVDDYNEYFLNQLFELLTEYAPIHEVWFDGAHPKRKGGQKYNYKAWKELIHKLAPQAVIFGKEDIRWCGNEAGATREIERNVVAYNADPDTLSHFDDMTDVDLGSLEVLARANYMHYQPAETNTSIREGWFYRDDDRQKVRSADDVFDIYERAVGGNSIFLLNIPPNREGRFSDTDVNVLKEVGNRIADTYGNNLLKGAKGPAELLDDDADTYLDVDDDIELKMPEAVTINRVVLQEAIRHRGERIQKVVVEAMTPEGWKEVASAPNVGYKRILRFPDVTTDRLRIHVEESRLTAALSNVTAHHYQARPPQLTVTKDKEGNVSIAPRMHDFGWKSHGENALDNLNAGYAIYYTLDGSEPTMASQVYKSPLKIDRGTLKAVAVVNGEAGPVLTEEIGYDTAGWSAVSTSSFDGHDAALTIDADPATYWVSQPGQSAPLTLDMKTEKNVSGFSYTPPTTFDKGMIELGRVYASADGRKWVDCGSFEFGNLINDPTKRLFFFAAPVKARFLKIDPVRIAGGGRQAAIAEIEVY